MDANQHLNTKYKKKHAAQNGTAFVFTMFAFLVYSSELAARKKS